MKLLMNGKNFRVLNLLCAGICLAMLTLSGCCMPVKRTELLSNSDRHIAISADSEELLVNIAVQNSVEIGKTIIDQTRSFAISPSNQKFLLGIRPNEYRPEKDSTRSFWTADFISIIDPNSGKRRLEWKDGVWKLNLYLLGDYPNKHIYLEFKLWTSWYCPPIHGPPN